MEILSSCSDCDEIQFKEDGNWAPMKSKRDVQEVSASYNGVDSGMLSDFSLEVLMLSLISKHSKRWLFLYRLV